MKQLKPNNVVVCFLTTILILLFCFLIPTPIERIEYLVQDVFFNLRGPVKPGKEIVIAAIDEKSIDLIGKWPWPRNIIADLVDSLGEYEVKTFGFDVVFSSPDTNSGTENLKLLQKRFDEVPIKDLSAREILKKAIENSDNDQKLHDALKRSKKVVMGYFFHFSPKGLEHLTEKKMGKDLKIIAKSRYSGVKKEPGTKLKEISLIKAYAVEATIEKISNVTKRAGFFNFFPALDGSARKVPLIVKYRDMVEIEGQGDYLFAPLSLTVLRKYLKSAIIIWIDQLGVQKVALMGKRNIEIPVNPVGEMHINYYGPRSTFPHYAISDIIEGKVPKEKLKGKIVMIGSTAVAIEDLRVTPFDRAFPGVEIHATIIDNILHERSLKNPEIPKVFIDILSICAIAIILLVALPRMDAIGGAALMMAITAIIIYTHYVLFSRYNIVVHTVPPLLGNFAVYGLLFLSNFVSEVIERRYIQTAFGQYLSPDVIEQIIKDPSKLRLGGMRKEMTVLFSDFAGFTAISEKLSPEKLVKLLNGILTEMSEIILSHEGTIDKYEGDAIISFFGAPIDSSYHATKCCLAAIDMQKALVKMRAEWEKQGEPLLKMRIGINTGPMFIGNLGSKIRMDYTVMGDAVNTAARLESVNKYYGCQTIIGPITYEMCKDSIEVRELDIVRVVGKQEEIVIYELLGRKGDLAAEKKQLIDLFCQGIENYRAREWKKGIEIFNEIIEKDPEDGPALTYLERCLDYQIRPPSAKWDGVHIMVIK